MDLATIVTSFFGGAAALGLRHLLDVPGHVARNDRRIHELDAELGAWVDEEDRSLTATLRRIEDDAAARVQRYSEQRMQMREQAKAAVRAGFREQLRQADRLVREVHVSERWSHEMWRRLRRRPLPELTTTRRKADRLAKWAPSAQLRGTASPARRAA